MSDGKGQIYLLFKILVNQRGIDFFMFKCDHHDLKAIKHYDCTEHSFCPIFIKFISSLVALLTNINESQSC